MRAGEKEKKAMNEKRGKFSIDTYAIEHDPKQVMKIMSHMIVVRAEHLYMSKRIEYIAISDLFDSLNVGEQIPDYIIELHHGEVPVARRI